MEELAAVAVGAEAGFVEASALLGLVLRSDVDFAPQLVLSVGERAFPLELTVSALLPVLAHLPE